MSESCEFTPVSNDICVINNCYRYKGVVLEDFVNQESIQKIGQMEINEDDTFIVSYPRTGTTWTEKILACLLEGISVASTINVEARFPFLDFTQPEHPDCPAYDGLQLAEAQERPRFIKSHLPPKLLPDILGKGAKVIFIQRDPRDTLVSHWHFYRNIVWIQYKGSIDAMIDAFASDQHSYGGYFNWYAQWANVLQAKGVNESQVHFLNYEKMKWDLPTEIGKLANFIGKSPSDEELQQMAQVCGFAEMKKSVDIPGVPNFIRSGKVGEGKETLNAQQLEKLDSKTAELKAAAPVLKMENY